MTVYEKAPPPEDPPQELSDEELQKIAEKSQKLIEKDKQVQAACVALLYAQQLYHAGLASLRRRCEEVEAERPVEAHLIASMKEASLRPFSRQDLVKKTQAMILPWLAAEIAAEQEREQKALAEQERQYEEARREESFRLPWPAGEEEDWLLAKDQGLILVGDPDAVRDAIEEVLARATGEQVTGRRLVVGHLSLEHKASLAMSKRDRGKQVYLPISPSHWVHQLSTVKRGSRVLAPRLKYAKRHRVDLLLVDDIRQTAKAISSAVAPSQHLQANYRVLRKLCDMLGAFLIGGAHFEEPPDLGESAWEILETRSELRFVSRGSEGLCLRRLHEERKYRDGQKD